MASNVNESVPSDSTQCQSSEVTTTVNGSGDEWEDVEDVEYSGDGRSLLSEVSAYFSRSRQGKNAEELEKELEEEYTELMKLAGDVPEKGNLEGRNRRQTKEDDNDDDDYEDCDDSDDEEHEAAAEGIKKGTKNGDPKSSKSSTSTSNGASKSNPIEEIQNVRMQIKTTKDEIAKLEKMMTGISELRSVLLTTGTGCVGKLTEQLNQMSTFSSTDMAELRNLIYEEMSDNPKFQSPGIQLQEEKDKNPIQVAEVSSNTGISSPSSP